jgi:hypothetical protein
MVPIHNQRPSRSSVGGAAEETFIATFNASHKQKSLPNHLQESDTVAQLALPLTTINTATIIARQNRKSFRYSRRPFKTVSPTGLFLKQDILKIRELVSYSRLLKAMLPIRINLRFNKQFHTYPGIAPYHKGMACG